MAKSALAGASPISKLGTFGAGNCLSAGCVGAIDGSGWLSGLLLFCDMPIGKFGVSGAASARLIAESPPPFLFFGLLPNSLSGLSCTISASCAAAACSKLGSNSDSNSPAWLASTVSVSTVPVSTVSVSTVPVSTVSVSTFFVSAFSVSTVSASCVCALSSVSVCCVWVLSSVSASLALDSLSPVSVSSIGGKSASIFRPVTSSNSSKSLTVSVFS